MLTRQEVLLRINRIHDYISLRGKSIESRLSEIVLNVVIKLCHFYYLPC
jgi:hypothetical protein